MHFCANLIAFSFASARQQAGHARRRAARRGGDPPRAADGRRGHRADRPRQDRHPADRFEGDAAGRGGRRRRRLLRHHVGHDGYKK